MNLKKKIIAGLKLIFCSVMARHAKKRLIDAFKNYPQSIRKLSSAYERFLKAIRLEQRALVTLKAINRQYTQKPILMKTMNIGDYKVSRKAKEILSETDIVCALERHRHCDWGYVSSDDWAKCNTCAQIGYGYTYSRHKTADGRYFCILTDCKKPKTKIVTEEELNAGRNNTGASYQASESSSLKKAG